MLYMHLFLLEKGIFMDSKIINILNNLIEVSRDGENGFRNSANNVSGQKLKTIF